MTKYDAQSENFAHLVERWNALSAGGSVPKEEGMAWLHDALHAAIKLEFSTIPPYLCALWSIKDQSDPIALSIRSIVQEEMLHMALACNMLVAIGGTPRIADPGFAPVYPGKLAGGVHKNLVVRLSGLTDAVLEDFLVIERPERDLNNETEALKKAIVLPDSDAADSTIGQFYDLVVAAFKELDPALATERQISGPLAWFPVRNLDEVATAVELIKHQGEGSTAAPTENEDADGPEAVLAHFYRFLEILKKRRITQVEGGKWGFGEKIAPVDTYPMAVVPAGGYAPSDVPENVHGLLHEFDAAYTRLLTQLGDLWTHGDQGQLIHAIETMFSLQGPARALMQIPISQGSEETYGPCFRHLGAAPASLAAPAAQPIRTRHLFRITIETDFAGGRIQVVDDTPWGSLVNVAVVGGTVEGPALNGTVLNMGGDWGIKRTVETPDGEIKVTELDCKLMIRTDNPKPALLEMTYVGVSYASPDGAQYFRTTPRFRTADSRYEAFNRMVTIAHGFHRKSAGPIYDVYEIL